MLNYEIDPAVLQRHLPAGLAVDTWQRRGQTVEYQVEHPPWRVWQVRERWLECDVAGLYGLEFAPFLAGPPSSAFLAEGSAVVVRQGRQQ